MSQNTDIKSPVESIPSVEGGVSAVGSAHAPFLYFEEVTAFGHLNGVIRVTLEAQRLFDTATGKVAVDGVIVAHLRMNLPAARSLKAALEGALLLASPPLSAATN